MTFTITFYYRAEVKERVELDFYSPSGSTLSVLGVTFTITFYYRTEVKERVELNFYSPSGSTLSVLG